MVFNYAEDVLEDAGFHRRLGQETPKKDFAPETGPAGQEPIPGKESLPDRVHRVGEYESMSRKPRWGGSPLRLGTLALAALFGISGPALADFPDDLPDELQVALRENARLLIHALDISQPQTWLVSRPWDPSWLSSVRSEPLRAAVQEFLETYDRAEPGADRDFYEEGQGMDAIAEAFEAEQERVVRLIGLPTIKLMHEFLWVRQAARKWLEANLKVCAGNILLILAKFDQGESEGLAYLRAKRGVIDLIGRQADDFLGAYDALEASYRDATAGILPSYFEQTTAFRLGRTLETDHARAPDKGTKRRIQGFLHDVRRNGIRFGAAQLTSRTFGEVAQADLLDRTARTFATEDERAVLQQVLFHELLSRALHNFDTVPLGSKPLLSAYFLNSHDIDHTVQAFDAFRDQAVERARRFFFSLWDRFAPRDDSGRRQPRVYITALGGRGRRCMCHHGFPKELVLPRSCNACPKIYSTGSQTFGPPPIACLCVPPGGIDPDPSETRATRSVRLGVKAGSALTRTVIFLNRLRSSRLKDLAAILSTAQLPLRLAQQTGLVNMGQFVDDWAKTGRLTMTELRALLTFDEIQSLLRHPDVFVEVVNPKGNYVLLKNAPKAKELLKARIGGSIGGIGRGVASAGTAIAAAARNFRSLLARVSLRALRTAVATAGSAAVGAGRAAIGRVGEPITFVLGTATLEVYDQYDELRFRKELLADLKDQLAAVASEGKRYRAFIETLKSNNDDDRYLVASTCWLEMGTSAGAAYYLLKYLPISLADASDETKDETGDANEGLTPAERRERRTIAQTFRELLVKYMTAVDLLQVKPGDSRDPGSLSAAVTAVHPVPDETASSLRSRVDVVIRDDAAGAGGREFRADFEDPYLFVLEEYRRQLLNSISSLTTVIDEQEAAVATVGARITGVPKFTVQGLSRMVSDLGSLFGSGTTDSPDKLLGDVATILGIGQ